MPRAAKPTRWRPSWRLGALCIGVAVAVLSVGLANISLPYIGSPKAQAERPSLSGSIVITSANRSDCRHLIFDNVTGIIKDTGTRKCLDEPQNNSMDEIAKSFRN